MLFKLFFNVLSFRNGENQKHPHDSHIHFIGRNKTDIIQFYFK